MKNINTTLLNKISGGTKHEHKNEHEKNRVDEFVDDAIDKTKETWDDVRHSRIAENAKDAVRKHNPFKHHHEKD